MDISRKAWGRFVERLSRVSQQAVTELLRFVAQNGGINDIDRTLLIDGVFALATKYGEGTSALAAAWYDTIAEASGVYVPPAEVAPTATYQEVARTVNGVLKQSSNEEVLAGAMERLAKMPGVDTTLRNAIRDGAEVAWIPMGDTCAFCLALAANGWKRASPRLIRLGHAEHIHANCDCQYAVRFDENTDIEGYDEGKPFVALYESADQDHWNTPDGKPPAGQKSSGKTESVRQINALSRQLYARNREEINAQKRSAYEKRVELNSSAAEEADV